MQHDRCYPVRLAILALGLIAAASLAVAAQPGPGVQSAPGSCTTPKVYEIAGLPPVDTSPTPAYAVDRPLEPRQIDPFFEWRPSPTQLDTGPVIDAPPLHRSFQGITETGWMPPDPILAAGPSYLVACVNSHIAYFTRNGKRIFQTSSGTFFRPLGVTGLKIFDPWVVYDETVNRFIVLFAAKNDTARKDYNLLAISKTASPLNGWWLYKNDMTLNGSSQSYLWGDYPRLASDRNAIYITANMLNFPGGTRSTYAKIRVLQNKSQLINGSTRQLWWDFPDIRIYGSSTKAKTIQPCHDGDYKSSTAAAYFCNSINGTGSNIYFYALTHVTRRSPTGPSFYKTRVAVGSYQYPGNFPQKGGTEKIENVAPNLMNAVKRNGSIWTAHSIKQGSSASACRWYEFRVNNWPLSGSVTKRQEQSFWGANLHYSFPTVAVNKTNDMAMVFNASNSSIYCGVRWTGRKSTDTLGRLQGSAQLKAGEAYYVRKWKGRNRWGDYSGCSAAPDGSIWFMAEYARPNNKWANWIGGVFYSNPAYWVANFGGTHGDKLLGVSAGGSIVSSITLPSALSPDAVCMDHTNTRAIVFDTNKIYRYYLSSGAVFSSSLPAVGSIQWGDIDEAGYITYVDSSGRLYRATSVFGSSVTTLRYTPGANYNAVAWNGDNGQYVAVTYGYSSSSAAIHFIARDGTLVRNIAGPTYMSGIDYDPFTGYFYITRFGGWGRSLVRMTQSGSLYSFGPSGNARLYTANSVECREQPSARLVGTEYGGNPQHLWYAYYPTGTPYAIHTSNGVIGPADLAINRQRTLWTTGPFRVGSSGYLSLNFGPEYAGDLYQVATSIGSRPGFALPPGWVHLMAGDPFIIASVRGLDGGAIWRHFAGVLNSYGQASRSPYVAIPNIPSLKGIRFFYAAVAYNTLEGVRAVSNMCGVTIQ